MRTFEKIVVAGIITWVFGTKFLKSQGIKGINRKNKIKQLHVRSANGFFNYI